MRPAATARLTSDPAHYEVARVHRINGGQFAATAPRQYPWLAQFAAASTRWSADAADYRIVGFHLAVPGLPDDVALQAVGDGTAVEWFRSIDRTSVRGAIELQPEAGSGEALIAVDRRHEDGRYGIQVERFWIRDPDWCPPGQYGIDAPNDPRM